MSSATGGLQLDGEPLDGLIIQMFIRGLGRSANAFPVTEGGIR